VGAGPDYGKIAANTVFMAGERVLRDGTTHGPGRKEVSREKATCLLACAAVTSCNCSISREKAKCLLACARDCQQLATVGAGCRLALGEEWLPLGLDDGAG
jgi:hypothetical protein